MARKVNKHFSHSVALLSYNLFVTYNTSLSSKKINIYYMSLTDKKYRSQPVLKALVKTRSKLVRENNHAVETLRMTLSHSYPLSCVCRPKLSAQG